MDKETRARLEERVGRVHLRQRLGIETDNEKRIFGQGRNFFHIENWYSVHSLMRGILRLFFLYGRGRRNTLDIRIRKNDFRIRNLPAAFDGYTILHISDLHLDMHPGFPHALIEAVHQVDYDLCVLTGDFRALTYGPYEAAIDGMRQVRIHLKGPVYGVLGNHDTICMVLDLEEMGVRMLLNEYVALDRGGERIYLAGIDDPHYYRADNLEKTADPIHPDAVSILLAHSPEIYKHAAHAGFNLMLSGHTHGGQICLPGGWPLTCNARCPRDFCSGAWSYQDLNGYTTAGSGSSIVDVRLNCPPEITLHYLRCAE